MRTTDLPFGNHDNKKGGSVSLAALVGSNGAEVKTATYAFREFNP